MAKKVTLSLSDKAHEVVARAADGRPVGRFLRDVLENYTAGNTGDAAGASIDARVEKIVDEKLGSAVSEGLKDQTLVELETAELIAERAIKWAKIAGVFLAVPAALFVALFSFLGVKTYFDLRDVAGKIADSEKTIQLATELSKQSQATSKELIERTNQLRTSVTEAEAIVERLRKVEEQIPELEERQRGLEEQFKTIEGRVRLGSAELDLEGPFQDYLKRLDEIGFPVSQTPVTVERSDDESTAQNAYYNPSNNTVVLGRAFWESTGVALREYTHHVLFAVQGGLPIRGTAGALETAFADYFPSSFLDDPRVGAGVRLTGREDADFIRTLENEKLFTDLKEEGSGPSATIHANAEVWGGLLWEVRNTLGKDETDRMLSSMWMELPRDLSDALLNTWFAANLLERSLSVAPDETVKGQLRDIWAAREFPTTQ